MCEKRQEKSNYTTTNVGDKVVKSILFSYKKIILSLTIIYMMYMLLSVKTGNIIFIRSAILEDKAVALS